MKKLPLALLALGAFVAPVVSSCNKDDALSSSREYVTITLGLRTAADSGTFPTKGISEEIAATLPATMLLTLTDTGSGESYQVNSGGQIRVKEGTYLVTGRTTPAVRQEVYGTTHYTSAEPLIVVEDRIEVSVTKTAYSVTAAYRCFVVALNPNDFADWYLQSNGEFIGMAHSTAPDLWWTYVIGDYDAAHPLRIQPKLPNGSSLDYTFYTDELRDGALLAEFGKWYMLRENTGQMASGSLALTLPVWTAGN